MAMPPGAFDFSALQSALNDPQIKAMAEQIANDPTFKEVTKQLQESFGGMLPPGAAGAPPGMPGMPGMPGADRAMPGMNPAAMDPTKYMQAMQGMFQNPQFMKMAENLGKSIIEQDPAMAQMIRSMQDESYRAKVEDALKSLKDDPEMAPMLEELEKAGPMAMMKYWNDPEVLSKLGKAMGSAFDMPGGEGAIAEGEEEYEEGESEPTVHSAASEGDVDLLKQLLEEGADVDAVDEEGRTALHFACGYGELDCAKVLLEKGAKLDCVDNNKNTALHYAAGYGQAESVKLLIEAGADRSAKNADGKTALEVAELNEQADVVAALKA